MAVHYVAEGAGEPLVLLHSVGQSGRSFAAAMAMLTPRFRVIAWDMPGHGLSASEAPPADIAGFADAAAGMLDDLGIARAHVAGVSIGAHIAMALAARHAARIASAALVEGGLQGAAGWDAAWPMVEKTFGVATQSFDQVRPRLRALDDAQLATWNEDRARAGAPAMMAAMDAIRTYDFMADLTRINAPVLALYGANSPMRAGAAVIAGAIPSARQAIMPDCGHFPMIDDPAGFAAIVGDFAQSVGGAA